MRQPMQPLVVDAKGMVRFQENKIVRYLLDHGGISLVTISELAFEGRFSVEDQQQFAQLTGYSLSGYSELRYVTNEAHELAVAARDGKDERDARIEHLQGLLKRLKDGIREPMAELFEVHPDDLKGRR